jgi:gamma-glutamylcyclotransferase (GGCT)/AIG2-like uncharacterized protein YtfP
MALQSAGLDRSVKYNAHDLQELLFKVNQFRQQNEISENLESELEASYQCSHHLVVYGTLAPGRVNHHQVEHIVGTWRDDVYVEGEFVNSGWAVEFGYPMMRWKPGGPRIAAFLLSSAMLPDYWADLDRFEGSEYCRILIPVFDQQGFVMVANVYAEKSTKGLPGFTD